MSAELYVRKLIGSPWALFKQSFKCESDPVSDYPKKRKVWSCHNGPLSGELYVESNPNPGPRAHIEENGFVVAHAETEMARLKV